MSVWTVLKHHRDLIICSSSPSTNQFSTIKIIMLSKLTLASLLAGSSFALPDVTVKELPASCSSYPLYDASTGNAGPWILQVTSSDNPAIESFGDTYVYSIKYNPATDRKPTLRWGYVSYDTFHGTSKLT